MSPPIPKLDNSPRYVQSIMYDTSVYLYFETQRCTYDPLWVLERDRVMTNWSERSSKKDLPKRILPKSPFAFEEAPIYKRNCGTHGRVRRLFQIRPREVFWVMYPNDYLWVVPKKALGHQLAWVLETPKGVLELQQKLCMLD